jgi:menaquinone-dependent protoporphyrinogen IX oxidase
MRALVIYESMYGNTHRIAEAIAEGMDLPDEVAVLPVSEVTQSMLDQVGLIVVGGPTHAHGMSRERTRKAAVDAAEKPRKALHLDPTAAGVGLRDWFDSLGTVHGMAAAFDTRNDAPAVFTGRAATGIAKMLRQHGMTLVAGSESFLVDKHNELLPGELGRAFVWGENLAHTLASSKAAT